MTVRVRHFIVLALALVIGFTSVQFAGARGQSPAVGTMEICTGTGPVHILVDQNGEPTGAVMICPDYALAFFADLGVAVPDEAPVAVWQSLWVPRSRVQTDGTVAMAAQARGPPTSV